MALRKFLLIATAFAAIAACSVGDQERKYRVFFYETAQALVPGYRLPDAAMYGPAWAAVESRNWRTRDGSGQTKAEFWTSGEFNGDGKLDYSYILAEEATNTHVLFAFVSTPGGYEAQRLDEGFEWGTWLRTLPRGRDQAAAQRESADSPPNETEIDTRNQAIEFFQFEGSSSSFVWNATTESFDRFRTSD
jgi:hypothetical protein